MLCFKVACLEPLIYMLFSAHEALLEELHKNLTGPKSNKKPISSLVMSRSAQSLHFQMVAVPTSIVN